MYAFRYAGFTLLTTQFTRKSISRRERVTLCNVFLSLAAAVVHVKQYIFEIFYIILANLT